MIVNALKMLWLQANSILTDIKKAKADCFGFFILCNIHDVAFI